MLDLIDHIDNEVKVKDHCHITGNYRGSAQRDCNINVKLKHKLFLVFLNLKNYDSRLITQELGKFNLKINAISNELKEDRILSINDTSQFLSFPRGSSVINCAKDHFQYLSQELDNKELDLVKKKWFDPYDYISNFEKFKEQLPSKENLYNFLTGKKNNIIMF